MLSFKDFGDHSYMAVLRSREQSRKEFAQYHALTVAIMEVQSIIDKASQSLPHTSLNDYNERHLRKEWKQ